MSRSADRWPSPSRTVPAAASGHRIPRGTVHGLRGDEDLPGCHTNEAVAFHQSVHYQWNGDASESTGLNPGPAGKLGGINDFCIYPDINWLGKLTTITGKVVDGGCARCHTGLGLKPTPDASTAQLENIDCLLCHSPNYKRTLQLTNGEYTLRARHREHDRLHPAGGRRHPPTPSGTVPELPHQGRRRGQLQARRHRGGPPGRRRRASTCTWRRRRPAAPACRARGATRRSATASPGAAWTCGERDLVGHDGEPARTATRPRRTAIRR